MKNENTIVTSLVSKAEIQAAEINEMVEKTFEGSLPAFIAACPIAFGEVDVKNRVKSVLRYKKPAFWIVLIGVISSVIVAVCFLTNPISKDEEAIPISLSNWEDYAAILLRF